MKRDTLARRRTAEVLRKSRESSSPTIRDSRTEQREPTASSHNGLVRERPNSTHRATRSLLGED